jgi:hypothetical protein
MFTTGPGKTTTNRHAPINHTFSLTVDVDGFWVEYLTQHRDVFGPNYTGYWAFGVAQDQALGWLVFEQGDGRRPSSAHVADVLHAWRTGMPLLPPWHRLDRAAALRAWEEGVKRWGVDWYEHTDGPREDVVIQLALLGEVRYG